jgi:hypothetical protein
MWRSRSGSLNLHGAMRRVGATLLALGAALPVVAQEPAEIFIRNGLIVTETGRLHADLRIRDGEIAEIAATSPRRAARARWTRLASWCCPGG